MKPSEYHACATGDCPHATQAECTAALLALADEQAGEIERLRALHAEIVDKLYGQGFDVRNRHLNGDTQPLDSWFEDNYWLDVETWDAEREAERGSEEVIRTRL